MARPPFAAALFLAGTTLFPMIAIASPGYVDGSTEMHAGPDYDYPTVSVIDDGAPVEVYGCLEDWSWCDVSFYDDRGWISSEHLESVYEGRRQPIAYVAPMIGLGILAFSFDNYWDNHYHGRPWYGDRGRWLNYTHEHHRDVWEGRRGDHGDRGGNWRGNDRGRHEADDRGNDDHRSLTRASGEWGSPDHRNNTDRRGAPDQAARENAALQQHQAPAGAWNRQRDGGPQNHADRHEMPERGAQSVQNNAPHAAPPPQAHAQPQPQGGDHHGGDHHGGDRHGDGHHEHGDHD